jgi:hypothetical protein
MAIRKQRRRRDIRMCATNKGNARFSNHLA